MVLVTRQGVTYYVDPNLYNQITKYRIENLKKEDQFKVFLVCGVGGSGKSAFANQMCALLDPKFKLESIGFKTKQFVSILKSMPNHALSFDEAHRGINKRNTMDKEQKELLSTLWEIRQLNQVIFLCTPSFFSIDPTVATELSDGLFVVYRRKPKRGDSKRVYFKFFNKRKKQKLWDLFTKTKRRDYNMVHTNFKGTVSTNTYVIPEADYRKYKYDSLYGLENQSIDTKKTTGVGYDWKEREARLWALGAKLAGGYSRVQMAAKEVGIKLNRGTIYDKIAQYPDLLVVVGDK